MIDAVERKKPYIWVTWLTPLLAGEDSCEWKTWLKAHYQGWRKMPSDFDSAKWNENHTALLNQLRDEYRAKCGTLLMEGQTKWQIEGKTAIVAGKMDLLTLNPNWIIDAKTGKPKNSHVIQMKIYLLAVEMGALPGISGKFQAVLRYTDHEREIPSVDDVFRERFFALVRRIGAKDALSTVPSLSECRFCDIADCPDRIDQVVPAEIPDEDIPF